jgi:hypothetical protein
MGSPIMNEEIKGFNIMCGEGHGFFSMRVFMTFLLVGLLLFLYA